MLIPEYSNLRVFILCMVLISGCAQSTNSRGYDVDVEAQIIIYTISRGEYESLPAGELDEQLSDFNFYVGKFEQYALNKGIKVDKRDTNHISICDSIFSTETLGWAGVVFVNERSETKVLKGVFSDLGYQDEFSQFFE
jgi:hypothetical protein